jgi:hypothetical protein
MNDAAVIRGQLYWGIATPSYRWQHARVVRVVGLILTAVAFGHYTPLRWPLVNPWLKPLRRTFGRFGLLLANNFKISNAVAKGMADAFTTKNDAGTAAVIQGYTTAQATDPDTGIGAQTLLFTCTMSATSFGAATDGAPGGVITANTITDDSSADATGTLAWFRMSTQSGGTAICDGSAGTSSADLVMNTLSITSGSTVSITSAVITMPES